MYSYPPPLGYTDTRPPKHYPLLDCACSSFCLVLLPYLLFIRLQYPNNIYSPNLLLVSGRIIHCKQRVRYSTKWNRIIQGGLTTTYNEQLDVARAKGVVHVNNQHIHRIEQLVCSSGIAVVSGLIQLCMHTVRHHSECFTSHID